MGFLTQLFRRGDPGDLPELIRLSREHLATLTAAHQGAWRLGSEERWELNQEKGNLILTFTDGTVATAPAQIIGTFDTVGNTWMWAWNNPSILPALSKDAERVRKYGQEHNIEMLISGEWACLEDKAWSIAAIACKLCGAQGVYRGPEGSAHVFMSFGEVRVERDPSKAK